MRRRWLWLLALLPAAIGLALDMALQIGWLENAVVHVRIDLATTALLVGLAGSAAMALILIWQKQQSRQKVQLLRDANNERRSFLRRLDHELKNPLMAVRAGLANLADTTSEVSQKEIIAGLETQTLRLSRMVADLRKLAELETRPIDHSPVDMAELLQEAVASVQENPETARRISLTLPRAPWPLPPVSGDRDLLFLLVHNLLDNALKFTRPEDTVELRALEDSTGVVIEVADTGPGIPEDEVPLVWEELYRGEGARGVPGSGLGLALVRAITERHGGQVGLRSRAGQGTVFTLRLPAK